MVVFLVTGLRLNFNWLANDAVQVVTPGDLTNEIHLLATEQIIIETDVSADALAAFHLQLKVYHFSEFGGIAG